ncbi:ABC transporter permease [Clostridium baratii]|uniref:ABC transporter permease n=1 Tax=Clostridium baratii TaxID=1561 RepID=UPI0029054599|nr:ABC transporter permease [Clostridium baratii]MDU1052422.1 ABC transporter permease [Clostridium baratii]
MKTNKGIVSILAIILGLLTGALLMLAINSNPIEGFTYLFQGGLKNVERIGNTIATATPLILTGLSVAFAFRTGLFNIGAAGQMLFGGFCATAVGLTVNAPRPLLLVLMVASGILGGAAVAIIPGILKAKFNVHEVVSTIMMNWTVFWFVYYMVPKYFKGQYETESRPLKDEALFKLDWLSNLFEGSYINLGIIIAIVAIILVSFILNKTTLGYELKAVGFNRHAAEYAGIPVNKNIVLSMMMAGGLAGLAGAIEYAGNTNIIQIGVLPNQGFDGIAVSLLGANSPIGVLFAALFFGLLYTGSGFMSAMTEIPPEIANTIMATIIYFAATSIIIERLINKMKLKKKQKEPIPPVDDRVNEGKVK